MAFNLGAFAGGLAKSGVETYQTMEAIESQKKRDEMVALQTQQLKDEMKGKESLRTAIADQGGEKTFTPNFSGTGGMDSNDVAPTPVQISASERRAAIEQRAIAGGADPEAAMRYTASRRSADLSNAFDTTMDKLHKESADRMSSIKATAEAGGLKGLAETFGPELKKAFGHNIQFKAVPGAAGEIVAMDGKKVVARYTSLSDATQTLEGLVGQEFESKFTKAMMQPGMFGSAKELSDFAFKRQEVGFKGREVAYKEARLPYENMKDAGAASYYAGGKGGSGGAAGKAGQAEALVKSGQAKDIQAAYRIMASKDSRSAVDQDWASIEKDHEKNGMSSAEIGLRKEEFYARGGFAPSGLADLVMQGKTVSGKKYDPKDAPKVVADFNKKFPNTPIDIEDLSWAGAKTTKKDEAKVDTKTSEKAEPKTKSAIPSGGFYSPEAVAARKAERSAKEQAALEDERRKRELDLETATRNRAILNAPLSNRGD